MIWVFSKHHFKYFSCLIEDFICSLSEYRDFRLCLDVARDWKKSLQKFFLYIPADGRGPSTTIHEKQEPSQEHTRSS